MADKTPKRRPKTRNVIGEALRAAREAKGITQAALVTKLQLYGWDIDRTSWVRIESGERMLTDCELVAIADVLEVGIDAMLQTANRTTVRRILRSVDR